MAPRKKPFSVYIPLPAGKLFHLASKKPLSPEEYSTLVRAGNTRRIAKEQLRSYIANRPVWKTPESKAETAGEVITDYLTHARMRKDATARARTARRLVQSTRLKQNKEAREIARASQKRKSPVKMVRRIHAENYLEYKKALDSLKTLVPTAVRAQVEQKVQFLAILETIAQKIEETSLQDRKKAYLRLELQKINAAVRKGA